MIFIGVEEWNRIKARLLIFTALMVIQERISTLS